ncbi:uncharacterized protein LOC135081567 [Ostrinia nubilalis]|uniref:uncharacterized protein LOC135081567 n=1 Tax=Ostrinia nubilalis TaxID=29057 RepID=UPI0030826753
MSLSLTPRHIRDETGRERGALGCVRAQPQPHQAPSRPRRAARLLGDARQVSVLTCRISLSLTPRHIRDETGRERGALGRVRAQPQPHQAPSRPRRAARLLGDARQVSVLTCRMSLSLTPRHIRDETGRERGALGCVRAQPQPHQAPSRPRRAARLLGDARQVSVLTCRLSLSLTPRHIRDETGRERGALGCVRAQPQPHQAPSRPRRAARLLGDARQAHDEE